jgi:uncharacterized cupredoxin-like copper-binding protein
MARLLVGVVAMRTLLLLALPLFATTAPSMAQTPAVIDVHLSNFRFTPSTIVIDHGQKYTLRLINDAGGSHDFAAPAFFDAAQLPVADRALVSKGKVELPAGETRLIHVTAPASGTYPVKCSHAFHKTFGMKGKISVR